MACCKTFKFVREVCEFTLRAKDIETKNCYEFEMARRVTYFMSKYCGTGHVDKSKAIFVELVKLSKISFSYWK